MLPFFPAVYEDEILYSVIARYHFISGNKNCKDTIEEIIGSRTKTPTLLFPSNIYNLIKSLPSKLEISINDLIEKHTLLPLYSPFITKEIKNYINSKMLSENESGNGIHTKIGYNAGGVCKKNSLFYCPICIEQDEKLYGEPYFHRSHQVQGVIVCPKHNCILKRYENSYKNVGRLEFIRLDKKTIDCKVEYLPEDLDSNRYRMIAISVENLLNNNYSKIDLNDVFSIYRSILYKNYYLSIKGNVKQSLLYQDFISHFDEIFLNKIGCNIDFDNEDNWLKTISRGTVKSLDPLKHILFIDFLHGDIKEFFNSNKYSTTHEKDKLWPCLNVAAPHYKQLVIDKCIITADYKTRLPVKTFECSCGFIYSRKGYDENPNDVFKIGRVKQFGVLWESKLKELILSKEHNITELSRIMNCDKKTIVKYTCKLGLSENIKSKMISYYSKENQIKIINNDDDIKQMYQSNVLTMIKRFPDYNRTQIRKAIPKQYTWLYRHDKQWLMDNLPDIKNTYIYENKRVDWKNRDKVVLDKVKEIYAEIMSSTHSIRITKSLIGKKFGNQALFDNNLDKMPRTMKYIESIIETITVYQLRRVTNACEKLYSSNRELKRWEVQRIAGIKNGHCEIVQQKIDDLIEKYNSIEKG